MTLRQSMILKMTVIVIGLAVLIGFSLFQINKVYHQADYTRQNVIPSILLLEKARAAFLRVQIKLNDFVVAFEPDEMALLERRIADDILAVNTAIDAYEFDGCNGTSCFNGPEDRDYLVQIKATWDDYVPVIKSILASSKTALEGIDAIKERISKSRSTADSLDDLFARHIAFNEVLANQNSSTAEATVEQTYLLEIAIAVIISAILIGVIGYFNLWIFREFGAEPAIVKRVSNALADGDLSEPIPLSAGDDASILFHLRKIVASSEALAVRAELVGRGNLEDLVPQASSRDRLGLAVLDMVNMLRLSRDELNESRDELIEQGKLASLGSMVAGVAHELNTPIGSSLTIATTLRSKAINFAAKVSGNSVKKSDLTEFSESTKDATELLEQILWRTSDLVKSFKQVAADQVTDARRSFDLATSAEQIISTLKAFHKGTKIDILSDIPDGIVLDGYPGALGQVLTNLVNNAVFHGFDEGCDGEVKMSLGQVRPATIDISVSDNGRGMTDEIIKRAFEPFFTTRMGTGGTGLGLTIVRNIVTGTLGGKISLQSQPGQGTKVVLTIPRVAPVQHIQEGHAHGR